MATCGGTGRPGGRVTVQVDMGPAQGPGFLGADPGQQAEHDVGVHQRGRPADIFQAGPQFHHRESAGGGDDRRGLLEGEGLGRPALLAPWAVDQGGNVAGDQVVGFRAADGPLERQVPHAPRRGGVPGRHHGQCLPHLVRGQVAEQAG